MSHPLTLLFVLVATVIPAFAADRVNIAEDEASHSAYNSGWVTGKNSGAGFGAWTLQTLGGTVNDSHAGFFIATVDNEQGLDTIAPNNKAFGTFANGVEFEAAVGFRTFDQPLQIGDSFSLLMECDTVTTKFSSDDNRLGIIGFSLRSGVTSEAWDEYEKDARFQFGFYQGESNYQVYDGEESHDTGVPMTADGVAVTVTLTGADTYDLEITPLDTKETTKLPGRKLAGTAGAPIGSFAIYNLDGERENAYFNGIQVSRSGESIGR